MGYGSAMATYIHAIPYMFYALVALIIVPLFIFGVIPKLGAMKSAYKRVEETGQVYSKESQKWNKNGNEEVDKEAKIVDFLFSDFDNDHSAINSRRYVYCNYSGDTCSRNYLYPT